MLPPLLFEAALNLRWKELERELVPVLALSTIGVVLSAAFVAWGLIQFLAWPMMSALAFGALIAATDPISVIALLRQSGVGGRLGLLIESESLFNDGAATVLFTLVLFWAAHSERGVGALEAAKIFAETAGGGLVTGIVVGLAAVLVAGTSEDHLVETALSVLAAFGSFVLAESFHGSGVLATVTAGVVMGNLGVLAPKTGFPLALSERGRTFALEFWEFAAFLANSLVFLLIGSATATVDFSREGWQALAIAIGLTLGARAVAVFPICLSLWPSRWRIPLNEQLSSLVGRLARGARARARPVAAARHAPAQRHPDRRLRRGRLLGHRPGPDGALRAGLARAGEGQLAVGSQRVGGSPFAADPSGHVAFEDVRLLDLRRAQPRDFGHVGAEQRAQVVVEGRRDVVAGVVDEVIFHHPRLAGDRLERDQRIVDRVIGDAADRDRSVVAAAAPHIAPPSRRPRAPRAGRPC